MNNEGRKGSHGGHGVEKSSHRAADMILQYSYMLSYDQNKLCTMILAAGFRVHSRLGPGLLESVYQRVLAYELTKGGLSVEVQKSIPILYDELSFDDGYRADLIVEKSVLLELKSVETLLPVHAKQVLTYIRLANLRVGYLLNFGEVHFKSGIKRLING
jgi:GxxExxY protein